MCQFLYYVPLALGNILTLFIWGRQKKHIRRKRGLQNKKAGVLISVVSCYGSDPVGYGLFHHPDPDPVKILSRIQIIGSKKKYFPFYTVIQL